MIVSHLQKIQTSRSLLLRRGEQLKKVCLQPEVEVKKYTEMNTSIATHWMMIEIYLYFGNRMSMHTHFPQRLPLIYSTPPSSTPLERIFSTGGEATTGKRNQLTNHNLEREILLRQNKKYYKLSIGNIIYCNYYFLLKLKLFLKYYN